jgi:predicted DsbA family dithiol-disulfide isomerase
MFRMTTLQASNTLEIISDVVCPWCYIGKRRLSRALALLGAETPLTVRWRAYELNPTMPPEGRDNAHPADDGVSSTDAVARYTLRRDTGRVEAVRPDHPNDNLNGKQRRPNANRGQRY